MAAVFNFLGVFVMTMFNSSVAMSIYNMVDFSGNTHEATVALCAALVAIVTWASAASVFGIPTSESHALIAGLSGAAIALHGNLGGINFQEWMRVLWGLVLSSVLGFGLGWLSAKTTELTCRNMDRQKTTKFFRWGEICASAGTGIYARCAGWPEVYERIFAWHGVGKRADDERISNPHLAYDHVLCHYGPWNIHWRV